MRKFLTQISSQVTSEDSFRVKITQLRLERNYGEATRLLQDRLAQHKEYWKIAEQLHLVFMQWLAGDTSAKLTAEQARGVYARRKLGFQDPAFGYCSGSADSRNHKATGESKHKNPKRRQGRETLNSHAYKATAPRDNVREYTRDESHS